MRYLLSVCPLAIALGIANVPSTFAQSPVSASSYADQTMQRGISVNLAAASAAAPLPDADNKDAWIVTVTGDGSLYFGIRSVTRETLQERMISHPRKRDQKLYIKADARTRYANVEKVLEAGRRAAFGTPVLLTSQGEQPQPGSRVSPEGLEVSIEEPADSGRKATIVEILNPEQGSPVLKINNQSVPWERLQSALTQIQHPKGGVMLLSADGELEFAQIVRVINEYRAIGAKVVLHLPTPTL